MWLSEWWSVCLHAVVWLCVLSFDSARCGIVPYTTADTVHHIMGMFGTFGAVYSNNPAAKWGLTWLQTNEISTIFLYPYLEGGRSKQRGYLFGGTFFASRILWNFYYTRPTALCLGLCCYGRTRASSASGFGRLSRWPRALARRRRMNTRRATKLCSPAEPPASSASERTVNRPAQPAPPRTAQEIDN
eukprot:g70629.t1